MQHSQIRNKNEKIKIFSKRVLQHSIELKVYKFENNSLVDITPPHTITNINQNYYSTEIITPDEDTYLLIKFCGSAIVIRVGNPKLQFFYHFKTNKTIPFSHYDEFGNKLKEGNLIELQDGFYYFTPEYEELSYVEVLNKPYVIHLPYCSNNISVVVDVIWNKKVLKQKFGSKTKKITFGKKTIEKKFRTVNNYITFKTKVKKTVFNTKTKKVIFEAHKC